MAPRMNSMYIGYNNERKAFRLVEHHVIVLVKGDTSSVLTGDLAADFIRDYRDLDRHLTGILPSPEAKKLVLSVGNDPHSTKAYNVIFDRHFDRGIVQSK